MTTLATLYLSATTISAGVDRHMTGNEQKTVSATVSTHTAGKCIVTEDPAARRDVSERVFRRCDSYCPDGYRCEKVVDHKGIHKVATCEFEVGRTFAQVKRDDVLRGLDEAEEALRSARRALEDVT